jgi:hypothetical protein
VGVGERVEEDITRPTAVTTVKAATAQHRHANTSMRNNNHNNNEINDDDD